MHSETPLTPQEFSSTSPDESATTCSVLFQCRSKWVLNRTPPEVDLRDKTSPAQSYKAEQEDSKSENCASSRIGVQAKVSENFLQICQNFRAVPTVHPILGQISCYCDTSSESSSLPCIPASNRVRRRRAGDASSCSSCEPSLFCLSIPLTRSGRCAGSSPSPSCRSGLTPWSVELPDAPPAMLLPLLTLPAEVDLLFWSLSSREFLIDSVVC